MSYKNKTYVIFDGDEDKWAYGFMLGWIEKDHMEFDFHNAHDLFDIDEETEQDEEDVKKALGKRMLNAKQVIVLVGDKTKSLYKYVRWEIELALSLELPIIVVNLNDSRRNDNDLCPPLLRDAYAMHVAFRMKIIQYALDNFPAAHAARATTKKTGPYYYVDSVYTKLGLL
jgi:hypothetical protein